MILRWDRHLEGWLVGHRVSWLNGLFEALSYVGVSGGIWLAIALALAVVRRRWQLLAWTAAVDVVAIVASSALQAAVGRARPDVPRLISEPRSHSFPSGHATTSFACAFLIASFAPRLRAPLFVLSAAIAFSRLYVGVHYPLDILGGAALGTLIGAGAARLAALRR